MPCPICHKSETAEFKPFCSQRCRHVDLGRWFTGKYAVPTNERVSPEVQAEEGPARPADQES